MKSQVTTVEDCVLIGDHSLRLPLQDVNAVDERCRFQ